MLRPRAFSAARSGRLTGHQAPCNVVATPRPGTTVADLAGTLQPHHPASSADGGAAARHAVVARAKKGKQAQKEAAQEKRQQTSGSSASGSSSGSDDLDKVAKQVQTDAEERMDKALGVVQDNFNTMRTGRANPAILDKILVDYYGTPTPIKTLASVAVPDASTLLIAPFDRTGLKDIEKAILESDLGINPNNDGEKIRLNIPPMTQDRRKELTKKCSKTGEDGKVAVRNVRKDALKRLDKYEFSKDARKGLEDAIQATTDRYVKKLDDMVKTKSEELLKM